MTEQAKATKPPAPKAAPKGGPPPKGGKKEKGAPAGATDPTPQVRAGTPRLQAYYVATIRPKLAKEFGLANPNQIPQLAKIVLNVGLGEATQNAKLLERAAEELGAVAGQKPLIRKARKAKPVRVPQVETKKGKK